MLGTVQYPCDILCALDIFAPNCLRANPCALPSTRVALCLSSSVSVEAPWCHDP